MPTIVGEQRTSGATSSKHYLRGSSLLFAGRVISIALNFLVQVLAVRYLHKAEYGALAWALAIAAIGSSVVLLGFNRGVARFTAIHHERREYDAMFGSIALSLGTVTVFGMMVVALVLGLQGLVSQHVDNAVSVALLLIVIALVPLDALDALLETLMAVFASARAIFFRRYVLAPALKLLAVCVVIAVGGSVQLLAMAYVAAGAIGIVLYAVLLWRTLAAQQLLGELHPHRLKLQARALFGYCLPLLTTDLILAVETPIVVIVLERFRDETAVADLRVAAQVAALCLIVFQNAKILFRPHAARLYARGDEEGLGDLYWRTAAWITISTFPVFAACVFLAEPITTLLFGERYASAAILLAILATGKFFNSALGMNTFTLQVYGRVAPILYINAATAVLGLALCLWLVPQYGAVGGAVATSAAIVIRNLAYQTGLIATTRIGLLPPAAVKVYLSVLAAVVVLTAIRLSSDNVIALAMVVMAAALALARYNRDYLAVTETFPELTKLPFVGRFLSAHAE